MNIQIMMTEEMKKMPVDVLEFSSNKPTNAIKRFGCMTIEDVIANWDRFSHVKGLGVATQTQIQNAIVNFMIQRLPEDKLIEWFNYLIDNNSAETLREVIEGFDKVNAIEQVA